VVSAKKPGAGKKATPSSGKPKRSSKTSAAPESFNDEVALLLQMAAQAPVLTFPQLKSEAKLFELVVLTEILEEFNQLGAGVFLQQPLSGTPSTFAGAPASADKNQFAWFDLRDNWGEPHAEAWISVQFQGLSTQLALKHGGTSAAASKASRHELDIALFTPEDPAIPRLYPSHGEVMAAVSVKHVAKLQKESVREALGFRREMGLLYEDSDSSRCAWLQERVPCYPSSPLFLASSAPNFSTYTGHIDELGVFTRYMKFPW